jgi:hypothetical protein
MFYNYEENVKYFQKLEKAYKYDSIYKEVTNNTLPITHEN